MVPTNEVEELAVTDRVCAPGVEPLVEVKAMEDGEKDRLPVEPPLPPPLTTRMMGMVVGLLAAPAWLTEMEPLYVPVVSEA